MNEAETIRGFSKKLVKYQRPIRILDSVKWTDEVRDQFFRDRCEKLPAVTAKWYRSRPLGFNAATVTEQFQSLQKEVLVSLGQDHPAGAILLRMCGEYLLVVRMLESRGLAEFSDLSRFLYGATDHYLLPGEPSIAEFGRRVQASLKKIEPCLRAGDPDDVANIPGKSAVKILRANLRSSMGRHGSRSTVVADDGIAADASAGAGVIKLRHGAEFSRRELRVLEVHEGWVHVGTTLNGAAQPVCQFLNKGTPSSTITQEGLAVLMEILALASSPARQKRINNRIIALDLVENGADFLEIFRYFRDQDYNESDSYRFTVRVFRGSVPDGKPFTKDVSYTKGFIQVYNFLRAATNAGHLDLIPLIFSGKTVLPDIENLHELKVKGLPSEPDFVPPHFSDLQGLAAWMCYDGILATFSSESLQSCYTELF